jgi:DNA-binding CsgD family transcriptional regulator
MQLTFNAGHTLGSEGATVSADAALSAMFDLIGRFKRPAAVLGSSGRPLFITREAEDLLGEGAIGLISSPKLLGDSARRIGRLSDPRVLEHPSGRPIMAQVLPIMTLTEGETLRLVLFTDPRGKVQGDPEPLLQLLGLTPAEAKLANAVGRGTSPQLAGPEQGVTRQTARSMMKTIFAKLEVSSQSQLAQLVTRLETA